MEWVLEDFAFGGAPFSVWHFTYASSGVPTPPPPQLRSLERAEGEIGAVLWAEAAHACLRWLETDGVALRGCRVLELGSGCGFVGLALAAAGARVTLSDKADLATLLEANGALARARGYEVEVRVLDWAAALPADLPRFDLVVGCDLLYGDTPFEGLLAVVRSVVCKGTAFRLAVNKRDQLQGMHRFVALMGADFSVRTTEVEDVAMLVAERG
jgi:predicted nicotinamide N-methyase